MTPDEDRADENGDDDDSPDDDLALRLAECDERLAAGLEPGDLSDGLDAEGRWVLTRGLRCVRLLRTAADAALFAGGSADGRSADGGSADGGSADGGSGPNGSSRATSVWGSTPSLAEPGPPIEFPKSIGRFEIHRELGRGGHGVVFLAFDPRLNREIALKVPRPDVLVSASLRARFAHEGQASAILDHPNIVPVYEAGQSGPICYLASAYCPGPTLAQWLAGQGGRTNIHFAAALVHVLAAAVQHAHSRGVLHRDLKPSNVLLEAAPANEPMNPRELSPTEAVEFAHAIHPRLVDFGLAKLTEQPSATLTGTVLGTLEYMAPEQANGAAGEITTAADVFALGAILFELIAGQPPFRGASQLQTLRRLETEEPASLVRFGASRDLDRICRKCLQKRPEHRYASAQALADDLDRFLRGLPVAARPAGRAERLARWTRRNPALAASGGLAIVGTIAALAVSVWFAIAQSLANDSLREKSDLATRRLGETIVQQQRAQANFEQARQTIDALTRFSASPDLDRPELQQIRNEMLETVLDYYGKFVAESGGNPGLENELAVARNRIAYLQRQQRRQPPIKKEIADQIRSMGGVKSLRRIDQTSSTYRKIADAQSSLGSPHEAVQSLKTAVQQLADQLNTHPSDPLSIDELARLQSRLALAYRSSGEPQPALATYRLAVSTLEKLAPADLTPERQLIVIQTQLGLSQSLLESGQSAEALAALDSALTRLKSLGN